MQENRTYCDEVMIPAQLYHYCSCAYVDRTELHMVKHGSCIKVWRLMATRKEQLTDRGRPHHPASNNFSNVGFALNSHGDRNLNLRPVRRFINILNLEKVINIGMHTLYSRIGKLIPSVRKF